MSDSDLAARAAARGNNLVCYAPPSPSASRAVLRGVLERLDAEAPAQVLALVPAEALEEWTRVAAQAAGSTKVALARTPARLARLRASSDLALLFAAPDTAHELVRRASLKPADLAGVILVWPEAWGGEAPVAELLQEVPKESQRIVVTSDPAGSAAFIERYCWRAAVADLLGAFPPEAPQVRSMPVGWGRRSEALLELVEQLDPDSLGVWIADQADQAGIEQVLHSTGISATVGTEVPAERLALLVAWDLPAPAELAALAAAGAVVLLAPPGTEQYVARLAPRRGALNPQGALRAAHSELVRTREAIAGSVERGPAPEAYLAIAPLLEHYEAPAVAAGLYELWQEARTPRAQTTAATPAPTRIWIGIGKRDGVTPHDLVASLINSAGVSKEAIGKLEIRESFSLVEVGREADPEAVAERLTGKLIRKRRLVARLDRGRPTRGDR